MHKISQSRTDYWSGILINAHQTVQTTTPGYPVFTFGFWSMKTIKFETQMQHNYCENGRVHCVRLRYCTRLITASDICSADEDEKFGQTSLLKLLPVFKCFLTYCKWRSHIMWCTFYQLVWLLYRWLMQLVTPHSLWLIVLNTSTPGYPNQ